MKASNLKIAKKQRWNYLVFNATTLGLLEDAMITKSFLYRDNKVVSKGGNKDYFDSLSQVSPKKGIWSSTFTACGALNCVTARSQSAKYPMAKPKLKKVSVVWPSDNDARTLVVKVRLISQYGDTIKGSDSAVLQWRPGRSGRWITLDKVSLRSGKGTLVDILSSNGFYRVTYKGKSYYRSYY
jgi:hypothetical protein